MSKDAPASAASADDLAKTIALMRISESVTLAGPALADVLAALDRRGAIEQRAAIVAGEGALVLSGDPANRPRQDSATLDAIAARLTPCPPPDVFNGYDRCPCSYGGTFPCPTTEAAWLARGLNPADESRRVISAMRPDDE